MTNPLPLALASLIMPYTSVHFPSSHKTAHGNGHCCILLGGEGGVGEPPRGIES